MRLGPSVVICLPLLCAAPAGQAADPGPLLRKDPHVVKAGFFDMHVCNWTDRPNFFLILFSTEVFNDIARIEVFRPDGRALTELDLARYRVIKNKGRPEKRVFVLQLPLPADAADGWYSARVSMKGGQSYLARDYVVIHTMETASRLAPAGVTSDVPVPSTLSWRPVTGASHYKVFIRDLWDGGKLIYESAVLSRAQLALPPGLIKPGGTYAWRVHARDVNKNVLFGDFNHGSLSEEVQFTTAP